MKFFILILISTFGLLTAHAQTETDSLGVSADIELDDISVVAVKPRTLRMSGAENSLSIGREELFRAACCNLGESFTTNPSVDVSYTDAATGARQIKLLGLSGVYVQMLTENLPNFRGVASPYSLGYVPGPWMQSIQVSKGASSVRNGYESITGQINVEYLKPEDDEGVAVNMYGNSKSRFEANADANLHIDSRLNTELLLHYEQDFAHHDDNHDGFRDQAGVNQWNLQNRWDWLGRHYIFHGGVSLLKEKREGGQVGTHANPYQIRLETDRYEAYMKHAFVLDREHNTSIALMATGSLHNADALFGLRSYRLDQRSAYTQLMFETDFSPSHNLSAGLSLNHDNLRGAVREVESTQGAYAQYTFKTPGDALVLMAGLRMDHSTVHGTFVTPRLHLKWTTSPLLVIRLSAGKGYRTVHALAENLNLLAGSRKLQTQGKLPQEAAWNYGISTLWYIPLLDKTLRLTADYYYTDFRRQAVIDFDTDPHAIIISPLGAGRSYSHTFQIEADYPLFSGMTLLAAYRLNDVRQTIGGRLRTRPLTSRWKSLITLSYKTPLELWQFDLTLGLNGAGRMPDPYLQPDGSMSWERRQHSYEQLSAQITRHFHHFSLYAGGENLTNFRQRHPIIASDAPWSDRFDPTMVWGPVHGIIGYVGFRLNLGERL